MAERRGKLIADDIEEACQQFEAMLARGIEVFADSPSPREAVRFARTHKLTASDTLYLDLTRRERLALATLDKTFRAASRPLAFSSSSRNVFQRCGGPRH